MALSRELAALKPEAEHLRSQLEHHNDVLAEKLALERQLNTVEVQLANEKRATAKAAQKQNQDSETEDDLRRQLREMEKRLSKETRSTESAIQERDNTNKELEDELQQLREQLSQLEKNLSAEKQSTRRAAKKQDSKNSSAEAIVDELQKRLEEAETALANEEKTKESLRQEADQALAKAEHQRHLLEEELSAMESQLTKAQSELAQCRARLQKAEEHAVTIPTATTTTRVPIKPAAAAKVPIRKKRRANEITEEDNAFQTPDRDDDRPKRPLKKKLFDQTVVVEKSTFSITPFLNKTAAAPEISPVSGGDNVTKTVPVFQFHGADEPTTTVPKFGDGEPTMTSVKIAKPIQSLAAREKILEDKKPRGRPKKPLTESSVSRKNLTAKPVGKTPAAQPSLGKVTEESGEQNQDQENRTMETTTSSKASLGGLSSVSGVRSSGGSSVVSTEPEPKKKKRKLLGTSNKTTLFDDDDAEQEMAKRPAKPTSVARGTGRVPIGKVKNAFAGSSFSPLKRERRGVQASFLV